jgi:hypothetical protein
VPAAPLEMGVCYVAVASGTPQIGFIVLRDRRVIKLSDAALSRQLQP